LRGFFFSRQRHDSGEDFVDEDIEDVITAAGAARTPPFRYNAELARQIELHWQRRWEQDGAFDSPNPSGPLSEGFEAMQGRPKFYVLDMFPYPSGAGLHVGHPLGYIGSDVFGRFLRMSGHHVLHTFGYDAFGLPAEQYAISTGQHPSVTTSLNVATMRRQLQRLGLAHDARREVATTDTSFYRWTQWIFLQIFGSWYDAEQDRARPIEELIAEFESGARPLPDGSSWSGLSPGERSDVVDSHRLAYISEETVNWCPGLGTVLANEEITADGRSDVGNFPVFRRPLRQWMMRITAYAERLLDDLDLVDWPEPIKRMQRNWIGASDGAVIEFAVSDEPSIAVSAFTTRPDTLAGATFLVLSPEHPLAGELARDEFPAGTPPSWRGDAGPGGGANGPAQAVAGYRAEAAGAVDRQRGRGRAGKDGVFTGSYVINPATGQPIPVFVASYVLMGYGTGAIMAVPAHDQRDFEFARQLGLPIEEAVTPPAAWLTSHGLDPGAPADTWPEAYAADGESGGGGRMGLSGLRTDAAIGAAIAWLAGNGHGHQARSYRLRDWLFSRQRYWGEPFPIVYDQDGRPIGLPENQLPVTLPEITDYRPAAGDEHGDPVPPLARAADWATVELDLGDGPRQYRRELNTMPQWAGSCWYYLRYLDPMNQDAFVSPEVERYWMAAEGAAPGEGGVDLYVGGVEHAVLHLLYARFWHKVLYDLGHVSTGEPFRRLFNQGYILADAFTDERGMYVPAADVVQEADGSGSYRGEPVTRRAGKMGKSLKNSISPDDMYAAYGADTLRLYEMAMGPLDVSRPWRTNDVVGVHRFLQRLWRSIVDEGTGRLAVTDAPLAEETERRLHRTVKAVREDFGTLRFNIAIAELIGLTSHAARIAADTGRLPRRLAEPLVLMVAPLAPHVAEELWNRLGHAESLTYAAFPVADEALAADPTLSMPVQVNGKVRFTIEVPASAESDDIERELRRAPALAAAIDGKEVARLVIVPGKIVSIVAR
jgi:leucyl-tRNA synthetase